MCHSWLHHTARNIRYYAIEFEKSRTVYTNSWYFHTIWMNSNDYNVLESETTMTIIIQTTVVVFVPYCMKHQWLCYKIWNIHDSKNYTHCWHSIPFCIKRPRLCTAVIQYYTVENILDYTLLVFYIILFKIPIITHCWFFVSYCIKHTAGFPYYTAYNTHGYILQIFHISSARYFDTEIVFSLLKK